MNTARQTSKVVGDSQFLKLLNSYWILGHESNKSARKLFDQVLGMLDGEEYAALHQCLETLRANLSSIEGFLSIPYLVSTETMFWIRERYSLQVDADVIMEALPWVLTSDKLNGKLNVVMQQSALLLWSAYETFVRDIFVVILNLRPSLVSKISESQFLRDRFSVQKIFSQTVLEKHGYSLQGCLGSLLAEGKDFSSQRLLRTLLPTILSDSEHSLKLREISESRELWELGCRRHLVAHRCGKVDQSYVDDTGDENQEICSELVVRPNDLEKYLLKISLIAVIAVALTAGEIEGSGNGVVY